MDAFSRHRHKNKVITPPLYFIYALIFWFFLQLLAFLYRSCAQTLYEWWSELWMLLSHVKFLSGSLLIASSICLQDESPIILFPALLNTAAGPWPVPRTRKRRAPYRGTCNWTSPWNASNLPVLLWSLCATRSSAWAFFESLNARCHQWRHLMQDAIKAWETFHRSSIVRVVEDRWSSPKLPGIPWMAD